jgi:2-polyprenyl-3-methyl-5-hydroxy-6-metoxy-1,4-benzoquinol methylase
MYRFIKKAKMKKDIVNALKSLKVKFSKEKSFDDVYYENLFIENPLWNKPLPNEEEVLRWNIIKDFTETVLIDQKKIKILDLGCGRGWLTHLMSKYGDVLGVEPVKQVCLHAKKLFPEINFKCGTTRDLLRKYKNNFDLVVSSEVIEHIPDSEKVTFVRDIFNLLKKNGYLILTTPRKEVQKEWCSFTSPDQPVEDWLTEKEIEKLIVEENFIVKKLERYGIPPTEGVSEILVYQLWLFQRK